MRLERQENIKVKRRPQRLSPGGQSMEVQYRVTAVTHLIMPDNNPVIRGHYTILSYQGPPEVPSAGPSTDPSWLSENRRVVSSVRSR